MDNIFTILELYINTYIKQKEIVAFAKFRKVVSKIPVKCTY